MFRNGFSSLCSTHSPAPPPCLPPSSPSPSSLPQLFKYAPTTGQAAAAGLESYEGLGRHSVSIRAMQTSLTSLDCPYFVHMHKTLHPCSPSSQCKVVLTQNHLTKLGDTPLVYPSLLTSCLSHNRPPLSTNSADLPGRTGEPASQPASWQLPQGTMPDAMARK